MNTPESSRSPPSKLPPCDACRRRKVKCDAGAPCERCIQSGLRCTRDIVRKRRGPKKGSGSVIAKLRQEDEQGSCHTDHVQYDLDMQFPTLQANPNFFAAPTSAPQSMTAPFGHALFDLSPTSSNEYVSVNALAQQIFPSSPSDLGTLSLHDTPPLRSGALLNSSGISSPTAGSLGSPSSYDGPRYLYRSDSGLDQVEVQVSLVATDCNVSAHLMSQCITQYFRHLYPIMPIIHEPTFRGRLNQPEPLAPDEKCLLLSLCAVTVLHAAPHTDLSLDGKKRLGRLFLGYCHMIRQKFEWVESAGLADIISSFFICISYFELKQPRSHHFFLREAIGMAHEQGFHLESSYTSLDRVQTIAYRRTFAVLFVTERGCAILRNKPTSITRLPLLPTEHFEDEDPNILAGFQCLCRLFALLDEKFVQVWRLSAPEDEDSMLQLDNIATIQHNLNAMSFDDINLTEIQKADVLITHQWLRLIFWQASTRQGLVSSSANDIVFSYEYPIIIAKALCEVMRDLSLDSILVHGLGIVSVSLLLL